MNVNMSRMFRQKYWLSRVGQCVRPYSAARCSLSSGTDMKIFWQNMVKISEEKQLIALAVFVFFY